MSSDNNQTKPKIEVACPSVELKPAEVRFPDVKEFEIVLHHKSIRFSKQYDNCEDLYGKVIDFLQNEAKSFKIYPLITDEKGMLGVYYFSPTTELWNRLLIPPHSAICVIDLFQYATLETKTKLSIQLAFEVVINDEENFIFTPSELKLREYRDKEDLKNMGCIINDTTISLKSCGKRKVINFCHPTTRLVTLKKPKKSPSVEVTLQYPITRYYRVYVDVKFPKLPKTKEQIMKFYERIVSKEHRKLILAAYNQDPSRDHNRIACCFRDEEFTCPYSELMSDLRFYEGLEKVGENVYKVKLGS